MCLRVTLGPYLSSEANGVVARRFKRKLFTQTAENDDFLHLKNYSFFHKEKMGPVFGRKRAFSIEL